MGDEDAMVLLGRPGRAAAATGPWLAALMMLTGCGGVNPPPELGPQPVAYADTLPILEPRARESIQATRLLDGAVVGEFGRLFSLRRWVGPPQEAMNVTHFDDVVGSSWFEPRNGYRALSPEDVARGPTTGRLDFSGPLRIVGAKTDGRTPGLRVRDARGQEFLFKFDPVGFLHLASAAEVISSRLVYAAGYNTPENYIVVFDGRQLVLDPKVPVLLAGDEGRPMQMADIVRFLSPLDRLPDGKFLAVASKILPGIPKGPFYFDGRRGDDPNDYYHHQYRRELRGLHVVAAWLNHVDLRFTNTYDAFVEPGYLRHYLIDFGGSLGSGTVRPQEPLAGREHEFDLGPTLARLMTLGFVRTPWQTRARQLPYPSLGRIPVEEYRPDTWKPRWPNQAYFGITPRDGYWGAKLVGAFTDAQIRAVVSEGGLESAAAADTLIKILEFRRDRTVANWYSQVTPIEKVRVETARGPAIPLLVTFDDLGIREGVRAPATTRYRWVFEDVKRRLSTRGEQSAAAEAARQAITIGSSLAQSGRGGNEGSVATLAVTVVDGGPARRPAHILLAWHADPGRYEVIGLEH